MYQSEGMYVSPRSFSLLAGSMEISVQLMGERYGWETRLRATTAIERKHSDYLLAFYDWNPHSLPTWKEVMDMTMLLRYCYGRGNKKEYIGEVRDAYLGNIRVGSSKLVMGGDRSIA